MTTIPKIFPKDATDSELKRQVKAVGIVSNGHNIKRKNKLYYKVQSQSNDELWYDVVKQYGHNLGGRQEGQWTCTCPDFTFRHIVCKHVYVVSLNKQSRKKIVASQDVIGRIDEPCLTEIDSCPKCNSNNHVVKDGIRHTKHGTDTQRYCCKSCNYRFVIDSGFKHAKANTKAITAALDLYFKDVSLRKITDHLKQFYNVEITHVAIIKWIRKFVTSVQPFVDQLTPPHLSGIYHIDEMMVHVRREHQAVGHYQWLWNMLDSTTRFWISSKISQRRGVIDARRVYRDAKQKGLKPQAIIHDGLSSYDDAYQKEFFTLKNPRVKNIRSISVRNQGLNSLVERLNGTVREREKVMRGMHKADSAQQIMDAIRIYYNFCREHQTLHKTPAEQAGIKLDLQNNKIESLVKYALKSSKLTATAKQF